MARFRDYAGLWRGKARIGHKRWDHHHGRVMGVWGMTHTLVMPMGGLTMGGRGERL